MTETSIWAAVAVGGAAGAVVRGLIYRGVEQWFPPTTPGRFSAFGSARSTLLVNTLGSLVFGLAMGSLAQSSAGAGDAASISAFWMTGLCGAITTFSTLCADVMRFARRGDTRRIAIVLLANTVMSIGALMLGLAVTRSTLAG